MKKEINVIGYKEGTLTISSKVNIKKLHDKEINVSFEPILKYKEGTDILGLQLTVKFNDGKEDFLSFGMVLTFVIEGWRDFISGKPTKEEVQEFTLGAWIVTVGYARGVLGEKLGNTNLKGIYLPVIDIADFVRSVNIKEAVVG